MGWGQIAHELDLHPGIGAIMGNGGNGNGNGNGHGGGAGVGGTGAGDPPGPPDWKQDD
jgi:hypothetical protein